MELAALFRSALYFGLVAGLSPSPHNIRMVSLGLSPNYKRHGPRFILEALSYDVLWIVIIVGLANYGRRIQGSTHVLSFLGGLFLFYLGAKTLFKEGPRTDEFEAEPTYPGEGLLIQCLNPNPILFWTLVALPLLLDLASRSALASGVYFIFPFILLVYAIKIILFFGATKISLSKKKALVLKSLSAVYFYQGIKFVIAAF